MEWRSGDRWRLGIGDCREGMATLPEQSVHVVCTSPPYWSLRDYGIPPVKWKDGANCVYGLEPTIAGYIAHTLELFECIGRVLRDDGVIFWNVGDSFITGAGKAKIPGGGARGEAWTGPTSQGNRMPQDGIVSGSKGLIPYRVAIALQDAGWCVRQDNVWAKRSPMPESVTGWQWERCRRKTSKGKTASEVSPGSYKGVATDANGHGNRHCVGGVWLGAAEYEDCPGCKKCKPNGGYILAKGSWRTTTAHEAIFMITKGGEYFCDSAAVAEKAKVDSHKKAATKGDMNGKCDNAPPLPGRQAFRALQETKNPRSVLTPDWTDDDVRWLLEYMNAMPPSPDVWVLSSEPFREAHFATFPTAIPKRCITAGTSSAGCCPECGSQWAPVVESERVATRPAIDPKSAQAHERCNVDAERHVKRIKHHGHRPTCKCGVGKDPVPAVVMDLFNGSGTTGQVARAMGRQYVGFEINPEYAAIACRRIETPLTKPETPRHESQPGQQTLFAMG